MRLNAHPTPFQAALTEAGLTNTRDRLRFALEVGVDVVTVWRWLRGDSIPTSHATRAAVADALHRNVDDLFPADADLPQAA